MPSQGITITINTATAAAAQKLQEFFGHLNQNLDELGGMGEMFEELGAKLAAIFTVTKLVEFTKEAINTAESLGKLQQKTGLALTTLTALREESQKLGTPFEELQVSLGMFSDKLFNAVKVGGPALQTFRELGIRLVEANGSLRSADDVLANVAEKFKELPDGPQKAAAAMDLFGRSGRELIPILNQGAAGIEEMRQKGGPITPQMVQDATAFNRSLREMHDSFELLFIEVGQKILPKLTEFAELLKGATAMSSVDGLLAAIEIVVLEADKLFVDLILRMATLFGEKFIEASGWIAKGLDRFLTSAINDVILWLDKSPKLARLLGGSIQPVQLSDIDAQMADQIKQMHEGKDILAEKINAYLDTGIAAAKGILEDANSRKKASDAIQDYYRGTIAVAISGPQQVLGAFGLGTPSQGAKAPVSDEAKKLIEQIDRAYAESTQSKLKLLDEEEKDLKAKVDKEILDVTLAEAEKARVSEIYAAKRKAIVQKEEDSKREIQLAALQGQLKLLESDPNQTEIEKKERLLDLMTQEDKLLAENIEINKRRVSDPQLNDEAHIAAQKQLVQLYSTQADLQQKIANTQSTGTFLGEFNTVMTQIRGAGDNMWRQVATSFKNIFDGAISSISNGITGLIMQTKTWGQALSEIGTNILTSIVQAIVQIGVRWVLTQLLMATAGKAIAAASTAAMAPIAAAQSAIWAAPATLATIASYGGAAAAAPGLIAAAEGITSAEAIASFASGGFTGSGADSQVAGLVHANEVVFSAPAVRNAGAGRLEDLHQSLLGKGGGGSGGGSQQMVVSVTDERRAQDLKRDPNFKGIVLDVFNKNRWRYGNY